MALCCPFATCEHLGKYFCWIGSNFPVLQNSKRTSHSGINCTELTSWLRMTVTEGVCMYVSWGFVISNFSPFSWVIKKVKGRLNSIFLTGTWVKMCFLRNVSTANKHTFSESQFQNKWFCRSCVSQVTLAVEMNYCRDQIFNIAYGLPTYYTL